MNETLQPGDIMRKDTGGVGIVYWSISDQFAIVHANTGEDGGTQHSHVTDQWARVQVTPPGYKAVKMDDLDESDFNKDWYRSIAESRLRLSWREWLADQHPAEPTEFGARITVTLPSGEKERWLRMFPDSPAPWGTSGYEVPGEAWSTLYRRGSITLDWDSE